MLDETIEIENPEIFDDVPTATPETQNVPTATPETQNVPTETPEIIENPEPEDISQEPKEEEEGKDGKKRGRGRPKKEIPKEIPIVSAEDTVEHASLNEDDFAELFKPSNEKLEDKNDKTKTEEQGNLFSKEVEPKTKEKKPKKNEQREKAKAQNKSLAGLITNVMDIFGSKGLAYATKKEPKLFELDNREKTLLTNSIEECLNHYFPIATGVSPAAQLAIALLLIYGVKFTVAYSAEINEKIKSMA